MLFLFLTEILMGCHSLICDAFFCRTILKIQLSTISRDDRINQGFSTVVPRTLGGLRKIGLNIDTSHCDDNIISRNCCWIAGVLVLARVGVSAVRLIVIVVVVVSLAHVVLVDGLECC